MLTLSKDKERLACRAAQLLVLVKMVNKMGTD